MDMRNRLCENGFSFEYSATFGQAIKASGNTKYLEQEYSKCILFDYSYKYFYHDGYGKDYYILNLDKHSNAAYLQKYLIVALLAFYQQQKIFEDNKISFKPFLIEKPLWIFVGGSVTKTLNKNDKTDVINILSFLANFLKNKIKFGE